MKIPSKAIFADEQVQKEYFRLKKGDDAERRLFEEINKAVEDIEKNAFCGIQIQKYLIPKEYQRKYGISNLWKYNLSQGWRLLYCLTREEITLVSVILEWSDHKEYEKRFKYKVR